MLEEDLPVQRRKSAEQWRRQAGRWLIWQPDPEPCRRQRLGSRNREVADTGTESSGGTED